MKSFTPGRQIAAAFHTNKLTNLFPRLLVLVSLLFMICTVNAQMKVQGRFLYNKCGQKVIIRGIEHMLYYQDQNQAMLPEIGKTGANAIRVMLDPALSAATLRQILQKCINEQKMYVSVAPWRGQDIWFRSDIKTVLLEFEDNIVLHVFGEAPYESSGNDAQWVSDATSIITRIRNAGYKAPMDIQSTTYGRDPRPVIRSGQRVIDADPLHNILFGVQMYWGDYYTGVYGMTIAQACAQFAALNYPVQVGACPSDCNTACGNLAWDESYKNQLGCMWWSWTGDEFELSSNGNYNSLTADGQYIINNSAYSMKKTSVRSIPCTGGADVTPPSVPTGLTSSLITQTSFRLNWTASTDNTAVTGYEIFRNGVSIGTSTTTSFNVTGLTAGTTHSMRVRARDAVPNWSAQSTALSVTTASQASVNLALRRPAFSSSNETTALGPTNAVDGSTTTRWSSQFSNPQWIYVDLGATYTFNRVVLRWEVAYAQSYQIQTSNNATTWTNVFTTTTGNGAVDDLAISGTGRYVRMYGTARGTTYGYSLFEFEVYGTGASARNTLENELVIKPASGSFAEGAPLTDRVAVYANPVNSGNLKVQLYSDKKDEVRLGLTTNSSQPVLEVKRTVTKGLNTISFPVNPSAAGLYFLIVRQGNEQVVKKVIINK